jgi:hypothetical protein
MNWKRGELRTVELLQCRKRRGHRSTTVYTKYEVPAPYDRIVSQLVAEDNHASQHNTHEARRRQAYAREVLDAFGEEIKVYKQSQQPPVKFRSRVLTPILQRQLNGIHDAHTPTVNDTIPSTNEQLSIQDATQFYLQVDPADPKWIRSYRRNLLYIPEARWHLGVVMRIAPCTGEESYNYFDRIRENHDSIVHNLESYDEFDENDIPLLSPLEIRCIITEGLEYFFTEELLKVVRAVSPHSVSTILLPNPTARETGQCEGGRCTYIICSSRHLPRSQRRWKCQPPVLSLIYTPSHFVPHNTPL